MAELNPYDTGERLEPHVWVNGEVASPGGLPRRTTDDDYGRVDFDADDGTTILTLYIERADNGYTLNINQHGDDYLHVTGANRAPVLPGPKEAPDPEYRTRKMLLLDAAIEQLGTEFFFDVGQGEPAAPHAEPTARELPAGIGTTHGLGVAADDLGDLEHGEVPRPRRLRCARSVKGVRQFWKADGHRRLHRRRAEPAAITMD